MDEGQKIKISPLGIVRSGSENAVAAGACNEVIGFEFKDGSLVPYEPVQTKVNSRRWEKIWVHKLNGTGFNNYIYLDSNRIIYYQKESDALEGKAKYTRITKLPEGVTKIDFVKNMIVYNKTVHLFDTNTNSYRESLSAKDIAEGVRLNLGIKGNGVALMRDYYDLSGYEDTIKGFDESMKEQGEEIVRRINSCLQILEGEVKRKEYISGACYLRYAIKLYDGSYINASQPVLVMSDEYYENLKDPFYPYTESSYSFTIKDGAWDNGRLKFSLGNPEVRDTNSDKSIIGLEKPQLLFIRLLISEIEFWYQINNISTNEVTVEKGYYEGMFKLINTHLEKLRKGEDGDFYVPIYRDSDEIKYMMSPAYYYGLYRKYQGLDISDFYLYGNRMATLRERIGFNSPTFKKYEYYKYNGEKLTYEYDPTIIYKKNDMGVLTIYFNQRAYLSPYDRGKGWTWGMLPLSGNFVFDNECYNSPNTAAIRLFAAAKAMRTDSIGQAAHYTLFNDKTCDGNSGDYGYNYDFKNTQFFRWAHDDKRWYHSMGYTGNTEGNFNISSLITSFAPNLHIGELAFGIHNLKYPNDPNTENLKSSLNMYFGRELYTPVYEVLDVEDGYKDLIQSVDIFMTQPVSMHKDYVETEHIFRMAAHRPYKEKHILHDELNKTLGTFYKIHSIPYKELLAHDTGKIVYPYISRGKISSLEVQPTLTEYGRSEYDYESSYIYNNKLHIAGITESLENYYKDCIQNITNAGNNYDSVYDAIKSATTRLSNIESDLSTRKNKWKSWWNIDCDSKDSFRLLLKFNVRIDNEIQTLCYTQDIRWEDENLNLQLFYPNYNAERVSASLLCKKSDGKYTLFPLLKNEYMEQIESANMSYINIDVPYTYFFDANNLPEYEIIAKPLEEVEKYFFEGEKVYSRKRDGNIFKVSSVNQPLVFPYAATYRVGSGDIIGFSSNAKALSQGQFGAFPLLVFTTEGVFAMQVDTSGVGSYTSNSPLSREVCINANTICQVDGGVYFASEKGLVLLTGSEVALASNDINGKPDNLPNEESTMCGDGMKVYANAIDNAQLVKLKGKISKKDFREYLKMEHTHISYVYKKNKLLVYNKDMEYSYFIDLQTTVCTKLAKCIEFETDNYPDSLYSIKVK